MNRHASPRFSVAHLKTLAGPKVFPRGEDYFDRDQVELLSVEPHRVLAQVTGSETYRTIVTGRGSTIDGECSCLGFGNWGFCKHMVATVLKANAVDGDEARGATGIMPRIRTHLAAQKPEVLVDMIMGLAERDAGLLRKLDAASAVKGGDAGTIETRLRKALTRVTLTHDVNWDDVAEWADAVDTVLDSVTDLAAAGQGAAALRLAEHALTRLADALVEIADEEGYCVGLLERGAEIHRLAAIAACPEPVALAQDLFEREMADDFGHFSLAAVAYEPALGPPGLAEYRRLATEAWENLPVLVASRRPTNGTANYLRLRQILDFFAERDNDLEARIALRRKDLSAQSCYFDLARFCLDQGRRNEALAYAEEGLWLFEGERPDRRLVGLATDLLGDKGRTADIGALARKVFKAAPSLESYKSLDATGREQALASLHGKLGNTNLPVWPRPADLIVEILLHENRIEEAWSFYRQHGAGSALKRAVVLANEDRRPKEVLALYAEMVEEEIGATAYARAVELIAHMARLQDAPRHASYLTDVKTRHARKRNLMKLLG